MKDCLSLSFEDAECMPDEFSARFLDACFQSSHYFSAFAWDFLQNGDVRLEEELEPYKVKTVRINSWPNYYYFYQEPDNYANVNIYYANETTHAIFRKYCHDVFLLTRDNDPENKYPEWYTFDDLVFFDENKYVVADMVTHEDIICIYQNIEPIISVTKEYGEWFGKPNYKKKVDF